MIAGERLSGVDRSWLLMDRPTNLMTIVSLIILSSPLDRARYKTVIADRFLAHERFRCYPVADVMGATWVRAEQFDLDDHVLSASLPPGAGQAELEALVGELASTPFNPGRPLWTFHVIDGYRGGSVIVVRIHHCYADGIALTQVLLSMTESIPPGRHPAKAAAADSTPHEHNGLVPAALLAAVREGIDIIGKGTGLIEKGIYYALHPNEAAMLARNALGFAGELAHISTMADDPPTRLKGPLSGVRRVAWADPLSFEEVRTIAQVLGCTINDVLVSTLAGALGRYLEAEGESVAGLTIRASVPVDLRAVDGSDPLMGNRFGLVFLDLPIGIRHPLERLYAVHTTMQDLKRSGQALATLALLTIVGNLPAPVEEPALALFSAKASLVASNVPGPREALSLAGTPISQLLFWVPQAGSIGTGVSMQSYNGMVQFGVIADRQLIPRPSELVARVEVEFNRLVFLVLLGAAALGD